MTAAVLEHRYRPRGTAAELFAAREPEVLIVGPAGTGKSRACLEKLHLMCLLNPGMRGLIVRKTAVSLTSSALVTWKQDVATEALAVGDVSYYGGSAEEPAQYRYTNGSVVVLGGMDRASRIMSTEYDVIYVQEATELTEEDWEALTTRLRNWVVTFQQLLADANPSVPTHWLKRRADAGRTRMLAASHRDNPRLYDVDGAVTRLGADYLGRLAQLTGVRRQRLLSGLWVAAEGLIYDTFDPAIHLVDRFDVPAAWTRWWSVDFGYTNPFVLQWWAQDPDGGLVLYRELYRTGRTVDEHATQALALVTAGGEWVEPKPRAIVCDHDAEGRATFSKVLGLATTPADKRVTEGIQSVQRRLRDRRLRIMRGITVERDAELDAARKPCSTEEELPGYIWDIGVGKAPKEQPVKADDHGMDALRYLVRRVDGKGEVRARWIG